MTLPDNKPLNPLLSTLLPAKVREDLVKASKIDDDVIRSRTIDQVVERAKRDYPQFFKQ